ncbi:MAG TPA: hypothetical protein VIY08_14300 [Candidatus Nitrosocosmicus sp.]
MTIYFLIIWIKSTQFSKCYLFMDTASLIKSKKVLEYLRKQEDVNSTISSYRVTPIYGNGRDMEYLKYTILF